MGSMSIFGNRKNLFSRWPEFRCWVSCLRNGRLPKLVINWSSDSIPSLPSFVALLQCLPSLPSFVAFLQCLHWLPPYVAFLRCLPSLPRSVPSFGSFLRNLPSLHPFVAFLVVVLISSSLPLSPTYPIGSRHGCGPLAFAWYV
jgi:hypothetical protein